MKTQSFALITAKSQVTSAASQQKATISRDILSKPGPGGPAMEASALGSAGEFVITVVGGWLFTEIMKHYGGPEKVDQALKTIDQKAKEGWDWAREHAHELSGGDRYGGGEGVDYDHDNVGNIC
jgi:hypothetical protein